MHRRRFFQLGGAAVAALALPKLPAMAKSVDYEGPGIPIDTLRMIENALDAASSFGFDFQTQVRLFGFYPQQLSNLTLLRDTLQEWGVSSTDVQNRCEYLIAIRAKLDERFGADNRSTQIAYLRENGLVGSSLYEALRGGDQFSLYLVAKKLGHEVRPM